MELKSSAYKKYMYAIPAGQTQEGKTCSQSKTNKEKKRKTEIETAVDLAVSWNTIFSLDVILKQSGPCVMKKHFSFK